MDKASFLRLVNSSWRMQLFLWRQLPSAAFMGVRVVHCDSQRAIVRLPYGWRSKNPFRSTYFAAQCAAGELSTGVLGLAALQGQPPVSMLVLKVEAEFLKKVSATLLFTCDEGAAAMDAVQKTLDSGEGQTIRMATTGRLPDGTEAVRVWVTWSFKRKREA